MTNQNLIYFLFHYLVFIIMFVSSKNNIMIRLNESVLQKLKDDEPFQLRVRATIGVSHNTMMKYIQGNSSRFTELDCLNLITEELQQPLSELIAGPKLSKLLSK